MTTPTKAIMKQQQKIVHFWENSKRPLCNINTEEHYQTLTEWDVARENERCPLCAKILKRLEQKII